MKNISWIIKMNNKRRGHWRQVRARASLASNSRSYHVLFGYDMNRSRLRHVSGNMENILVLFVLLIHITFLCCIIAKAEHKKFTWNKWNFSSRERKRNCDGELDVISSWICFFVRIFPLIVSNGYFFFIRRLVENNKRNEMKLFVQSSKDSFESS